MNAKKTTIQALGKALVFCLPFGTALAGQLADSPLSLKGSVPPNVLFTLSVEYPTANTAAYQGTNDYAKANEYLGYFDPKKCYAYSSTSGSEWFYPVTAASTDTDPEVAHSCGASGNWSGNLLNWATMTGLDEFRFAMTGGHRYLDTATDTVIERTYQSGQGGLSNYPNKDFTDAAGDSTPFSAGSTVNFQNQGRGVKVQIATGASTDTGTCSSPTLVGGVFSCAGGIATPSTGNGACTTVTGTGTLASPYKCTAMSGGFSSGAPTTIAAVTPPTLGGAVTPAAVTCANPQLAGGTTFECGSITLDGTQSTATCNTWTGNGSLASPYTCASFSSFSQGETFSPSGAPTLSSFNTSALGANQTESAVTCSVDASSPYTTTCSFGGHTATCSTYSGTTKTCTSFGFLGGEQYVSSSRSGSNTVTRGGTKYYSKYNITYKPVVNSTYHYASSYPGGTGNGYYYTSIYNLTWAATAAEYYVRVKVCDSIGYEENCAQYGSSRKPTGVLQDNSERMRFGVFSYFNADDTDNAVMRSKLKYIAPMKYSPSGTSITNTLAEWSATDGTLIQNPDASDAATNASFVGSPGNSGVINYINKFGRTATTYKGKDNISKLYYESLKYLRGLQATPAFYQGARASNADGFPVITTWDDPVQYSCQKNYIITMGDTHTHCDKRLPGGSYGSATSNCPAYTDSNANAHPADSGSLSGDTLNVTTQTNSVGTLEGIANLGTSNALGRGSSYHIAGLSKFGASSDIRPDLLGKQTVTSFIIDVEEYKDCGYNSQFWLAAKYGNPPSYDLTTGDWIASPTVDQNWSQVLNLPAGTCSDRKPPGYADATGGNVTWPKNLLRAGDPLSMIASVRSAISQIAAQVGIESGLAQSSGSIDTGTGAYVYRAMYNSAGWTGDVLALLVSTDGSISTTPAWKASAKLPSAAGRNIVTFNDGQAADRSNESNASSRRGLAFTTANFTSLSTYQKAQLNQNQLATVDDYGVDRVSFLRGQRDGERFLPGTTNLNTSPNNRGFRSRISVLGDFLNSTPVFVSNPQSTISGDDYRTFALSNANRKKMLYVGGNDGMLHAFDASYTINATTAQPEVTADSGKEVFAYVPSAVYSKLNQLTAESYTHKYYVDGTPTTGDACFGNCSSASNWKTILVGGLNAGGQGIYALDITDPGSFNASSVLWEFNDQDDADLGYTFGKPVIAKLNNGKWAVIFGNGYNNTTSDGKVSSTGRAYLYIAYVDGPGAGNSWVEDTHYFKIELKAPGEPVTLPNNPANGLGHVLALDKNLDGQADYVYATDRKGNLWKIDLSSTSPSNWKAAFGTSANPLPLFTAASGSSTAQQFTTGLTIARHPYGGFMIMTGTGSWIDTTDASTSNSDSLYGIWDKDDGSTRVTRADLQKQRALLYTNDLGTGGVTTSGEACVVGTSGCTACTATLAGCVTIPSTCTPNYTSATAIVSNATPSCPSDIAYPVGTTQQLGWVYDLLPLASNPPALPSSQLGTGVGERTYSDRPSLLGNIVVFEALTPASSPCTGNTSGTDFNLSWLSGGGAPTGVSLSPANPSGKVNLPGSSYAGQGTTAQNLAIGGRAKGTGASKGSANLTAKKQFCSALPPGTPGAPPLPCTGTACTGYIPGWGFLSNLSGNRSQPTRCICAAQSEVSGNNTVISEKCNPKLIPSQIGRLTWKQISR